MSLMDSVSKVPALWSPEWLPRLPQRLVEMLLEYFSAPEWLVSIAGIATAAGTVAGVFLGLFALLSLVERKTLARIQNRIGPNRAGWFGILQPVADGIKMLTKEDIVPEKAEWLLHLIAPILIVVPAILALGVIPYGREWTPVPLELGLVFFFALGAMTEVAIFMAGWASGSKFPMLGAMRAISSINESGAGSDARKRPVDRSTQASPRRFFRAFSPGRQTASRKLLLRGSSDSSSVIVPGVRTRTTSRSTSPLLFFGSLVCSQTATL